MKLSPEKINRVEQALGLPAGQLLVDAGFVDPSLCLRDGGSDATPRQAVRWHPNPNTPARFPERVVAWLDDFRPLIDSLCVLRATAYDEHALHALLKSHPVLTLRLGWELWEAMSVDAADDSSAIIESIIGRRDYGRCRYALWGEELASADRSNVVLLGR